MAAPDPKRTFLFAQVMMLTHYSLKEMFVEIDGKWLEERGALNDARIEGVKLTRDRLSIHINDEWSNCEGLPGYLGPVPGAIEISSLRESVVIDPRIMKELIGDVIIEDLGDGYTKVSVICFGQYSMVAIGKRVGWMAGARPKE
jgi:hypothetical protein